MRQGNVLPRFIRVLSLVTLLGFSILCFGCVPKGESPQLGQAQEPLPSPIASPYAGTPLVFLDDYPVTASEIEDFARANLGEGSHHGSGTQEPDLFKLLPGLIRQYAGVRYALDHKLDRTRWAVDTSNLFRLAQMAGPMTRKIRETIYPPAEQIRERLPGRWLKMNFEIRVFPDLQAAHDAYRMISEGTPFSRVTGSQALKAKSEDVTISQTGLVFPDSGFFDPADDGYLFTLSKGEVSHPVVTGLGPAIVRVVERKDFSEEEKAVFLEKVTQEITQSAVNGATREAINRSKITIHEDVLAEAVYLEIEGMRWSEEVVARVDDIDIPYRYFRALKNISTAWFVQSFPRDKWPSTMRGYLLNVVEAVALGLEAQRQGIEEPEGVRKGIHLFQWKMLFDLAQNDIRDNLKVEVIEDEMLAEYHQDLSKYELQDQLSIRYYFTPDRGGIQALWKKHEEGRSFEELGTDLAGSGSPHAGSEVKMRSRVVSRGRNTDWNPLNTALFTLKAGEIRVLEGPMGYYLVKVDSSTKGRQRGFDEVKDEVREAVAKKKREVGLSDELKKLENRVSVRFHEGPGKDEIKGTPAPGTLDRG